MKSITKRDIAYCGAMVLVAVYLFSDSCLVEKWARRVETNLTLHDGWKRRIELNMELNNKLLLKHNEALMRLFNGYLVDLREGYGKKSARGVEKVGDSHQTLEKLPHPRKKQQLFPTKPSNFLPRLASQKDRVAEGAVNHGITGEK